MYKIETKKDVHKIIRTLLEAVLLIVLAALVVRALTSIKAYVPYDMQDKTVVSGEDKGFIAVSYFGVDRQGTDTLISTAQVDEQLKALNKLGFVTVCQQDILNYYNNGTPLPDKALFLMFEDGRRDTALFSQKILERYNYKASALSYADKFAEKDPKFLSAKDLKSMEDTGFWELGTNGYRLSYINCYDRYDRFLGQMTSDEFVRVNQYLGRDYNHYLMDFIRDKDRIPTESSKEMTARITQDYRYMEEIYSRELGYVPLLYCLMHSNTGRFGNNAGVSAVNADNIEDTFALNFNRDGFAHNTRAESVYDLTRLQPQAYWSTNHLLMRIWDDLPENQKQEIVFVEGEGRRAEADKRLWELASGAAEYKKDNIILTSLPQAEGVLTLKDADAKDVNVSVELKGNKIGTQTIYLRANEDRTQGVSVGLENNHLIIRELDASVGTEVFDYDLHELTPISNRVSIEEDMRSSLRDELNMRGRFAYSATDSLIFYKAAYDAEKTFAAAVADGAEEYIGSIEINALGDTKLDINLSGDRINVAVNEENVTGDGININADYSGSIAIGSNWGGWGYSQRNVADDVYDAVFKNLCITDGDKVLYDNRLKRLDKVLDVVGSCFNKVVNWFIEHL